MAQDTHKWCTPWYFSFCSASCIWRRSSVRHQIHLPTHNDNTGSEIASMHVPRHASVHPTSTRKVSFHPFLCDVMCLTFFQKFLYPGGAREIMFVSRPTSLRSKIHTERTNGFSESAKQVRRRQCLQAGQHAFSLVQVVWSRRPTPQGTGHGST